MANSLPKSLYHYAETDQRRFMIAFEGLPFTIEKKAAILREIESWLGRGVQAPTARQSSTGWHKKFDSFVVEGEEGSILYIADRLNEGPAKITRCRPG